MSWLIVALLVLGYWGVAGFITLLMLIDERENKTEPTDTGDVVFSFVTGGALLPAVLVYKALRGE